MTLLQKYCAKRFSNSQFFFDVSLKNYCYFRSGGLGECLLQSSSMDEVCEILFAFEKSGIEILPIGFGSNVLMPDKGIIDKVIVIPTKNHCEVTDEIITVSAGTFLPKVQGICSDLKLRGFEFATGIPGSVGGSIKMNAGTKLGEIKDVIQSIRLLEEGKVKSILREKLDMRYRSSNITQNQFIIDATFKLQKVESKEILQSKNLIQSYLKYRKKMQPLNEPSFGSCFKNPGHLENNSSHQSAAHYIEQSGLKGLRIGDAAISEKHSNFIINKGEATTGDAIKIIDTIRKNVYQKWAIELILEVQII